MRFRRGISGTRRTCGSGRSARRCTWATSSMSRPLVSIATAWRSGWSTRVQSRYAVIKVIKEHFPIKPHVVDLGEPEAFCQSQRLSLFRDKVLLLRSRVPEKESRHGTALVLWLLSSSAVLLAADMLLDVHVAGIIRVPIALTTHTHPVVLLSRLGGGFHQPRDSDQRVCPERGPSV